MDDAIDDAISGYSCPAGGVLACGDVTGFLATVSGNIAGSACGGIFDASAASQAIARLREHCGTGSAALLNDCVSDLECIESWLTTNVCAPLDAAPDQDWQKETLSGFNDGDFGECSSFFPNALSNSSSSNGSNGSGGSGGSGGAGGGGGDDDDGEAPVDEEEEMGACGEEGEERSSPEPVSLINGAKTETATDLRVRLPGTDLVWSRHFSSVPAFLEGSTFHELGVGWTSPHFARLTVFPGSSAILTGMRPNTATVYEADVNGFSVDVGAESIQLATTIGMRRTATGPSTYTDVVYDTHVKRRDGGSSYHFLRCTGPNFDSATQAAFVGRLVAVEDYFGNRWDYIYDAGLLVEIVCTPDGAADPVARLAISYNGSNRVRLVEVERDASGGVLTPLSSLVVTQRCEYEYFDDVASPHSDLGLSGSLVAATGSTLVSAARDANGVALTASPYYRRTTLYRYHNGIASGGVDPRLQLNGADHQLKAVIGPEQFEYFMHRLPQAPGATIDSHYDDAKLALLQASDNQDLLGDGATTTWDQVVSMATKLVGYRTTSSDRRVAEQYVQASGCCGGAGAVAERRRYDYYTWTGASPGQSTKVTYGEKTESTSPEWRDYKAMYYDYERLGATSASMREVYSAVVELNEVTPGVYSHGREWVQRTEYEEAPGPGYLNRLRVFTPEATSGYTAFDEGGLSDPLVQVDPAGLYYSFGYNAQDRQTSYSIHPGGGAGELIWTRTYSSVPGREHLVASRTRFRTADGLASADDDREVTTYAYTVRADGTVASRQAIEERELESELGPATVPGGNDERVVSRFTLFNEVGQREWSIAEDGAAMWYEYDPVTGRRLTMVANADLATPGGTSGNSLDELSYALPAGTDSGWGRVADGGEAVTSVSVDVIGRVVRRKAVFGRESYYSYELRQDDEHDDQLFMANIMLPHDLGGGQWAGPGSVAWVNAAGRTVRTSEYVPLSTTYASGVLVSYDLDEAAGELSRAVSYHSLAGTLEATRAWHDVSSTSAFLESTFEYDSRGRVARSISPDGTIQATTYDVLDRPIERWIGTTYTDESTNDLVIVQAMFYDKSGAPGATDDPNLVTTAGNGYLTFVREHVDDTSIRITERKYDGRGRAVFTTRPLPPHVGVYYDNLDRVIEQGSFGADTSVAALYSGGDLTTADRLAHSRTHYSQRGLVWRTEAAIDGDTPGDGYLRTNAWFDEVGRVIARRSANSATALAEFDGMGRATDISAVAEAPLDYATASDYAGAWATRLSRAVTEYDSSTQLPRLASRFERIGDAADGSQLVHTNAIPQYVRYEYDDAGRQIASVNFGTADANDEFVVGGAAPVLPVVLTHPIDVPAAIGAANATDDWIVSLTEYNARGLVSRTRHPRGFRADELLSNVPAPTSDFLVEEASYDMVTLYDDLSRTIATVENADRITDNSDLMWSATHQRWEVATGTTGIEFDEPDRDRVTSLAYEDTHLRYQVAHIPEESAGQTTESVQVTEYFYEVRSNDPVPSQINSNGLVGQVRYPDEATGQPGTANEFIVRRAYNRLGELITLTDQNQTVHAYTRDALGRVEVDAVSVAVGGSIDAAVDALGFDYDAFGRLATAESRSGATVLNAVAFRYNDLGQVEAVQQRSDGGISGPSDGHTVEYEYSEDPTGNHSRLTGIRYPNEVRRGQLEPTVGYKYGTVGSVDDLISRISTLSVTDFDPNPPAASADPIATYQYAGLSRMRSVELGLADPLTLDRAARPNGTRTYTTNAIGNGLPALDRFGRVRHHMWLNAAFFDDDVSALPIAPAVLHRAYDYDSNSNRLYNLDARPGAHVINRDSVYVYDGLNRLNRDDRGDVNVTPWATAPETEIWHLDTLGNWESTVHQDGLNMLTATYRSQEHNAANEVTDDTIVPPPPAVMFPRTPAYDANGNLTAALSSSPLVTYVYDAWNRLVKIEDQFGSTPKTYGEYEYNPLNWRTKRRFDSSKTGSGQGLGVASQEREYVYSASWQILEEYVDHKDGAVAPEIDPAGAFDGTVNWVSQHFWGTRYIDDYVAKRIDRGDQAPGESESSRSFGTDEAYNKFFFLSDAQFSVLMSVRDTGEVVDNLLYSAYGEPERRHIADLDENGRVEFPEDFNDLPMSPSGIVDSGYLPDAELAISTASSVYDGNFNESLAFFIAMARPMIDDTPEQWLSDVASSDGPDNGIGYSGYVYDIEASGRYYIRFRYYSPGDGRWLSRDPLQYADGMLRYQYAMGDPSAFVDPSGLESVSACCGNILDAVGRALFGRDGKDGPGRAAEREGQRSDAGRPELATDNPISMTFWLDLQRRTEATFGVIASGLSCANPAAAVVVSGVEVYNDPSASSVAACGLSVLPGGVGKAAKVGRLTNRADDAIRAIDNAVVEHCRVSDFQGVSREVAYGRLFGGQHVKELNETRVRLTRMLRQLEGEMAKSGGELAEECLERANCSIDAARRMLSLQADALKGVFRRHGP